MISRDQVISRDVLKKLSEANNFRAASDLTLRFFFHVGCIALSYHYLSTGSFAFGLLCAIPHFIAFSFLGWAGIGHELFHGTVFSNRKVNIFFFRLLSILTWNNFGYFEVTHWKHHKDTLLPDDPEGNPSLGLKSSGFVWLFSLDVPGFVRRLKVLMLNAVNIVPGPLGLTLFKNGTEQRVALVKSARGVLCFHVALVLLFVITKTTYLVALITLAPFSITFFNRLFAVSQHYGTQSVATPDYLLTTRTVVLDPISSFLYANMNYHIEHHYFPSIPYYNLPKVHTIMREKLRYLFFANGIGDMMTQLRERGCFKG